MTKARIAGVFYLINILTGASALFLRGTFGVAALLVATACYVAVTVLFHDLFKPVNWTVSLVAMYVGLAGCAVGALGALRLTPASVSPLPFFGVYCLLIGYLIVRSTFLPRILGVLMALGGFGWLTFISPAFGNGLAPYSLAPGIVGEGALTLWLLVVGVRSPARLTSV